MEEVVKRHCYIIQHNENVPLLAGNSNLNTNLCRDVTCFLHERHLCRALDGPERVYERPERVRHRPRLQQGTHVSLVEPRVGGLRAVVPQQSA